jgi:hypothetical protein
LEKYEQVFYISSLIANISLPPLFLRLHYNRIFYYSSRKISWLELAALFDNDVRCREKDRYCGDDGEGGEGYQTEPLHVKKNL